jgi:hypothetical protein
MSSIKLIRFLCVRGPQRLLDQMGIKPSANLLVTGACFISEDKKPQWQLNSHGWRMGERGKVHATGRVVGAARAYRNSKSQGSSLTMIMMES